MEDYPAEYQIVQSSVSRLVGELDDRVLTEPLQTLKTEAAAERPARRFRQYREADDENLTCHRLKLFREPFLIYRL
ncbi:hypothetical protein DP107_19585 [Haloglomus irregulare]|uniref:Uncharacterized protein n=1 Tax=Haloglomus irregulare TaxID=2234134 RepID=A0A554MTQ7_9EURY|nr:hypothetical protein [Haloglomus irregulare]TSD08513.1 hypothetical protein DP107_19585 [Haloglomus irregulare]